MHITGTEYYVLVLCTALLLLSITMLLSMYSGVCIMSIMSIDTPYICIRSSSYYGIIT